MIPDTSESELNFLNGNFLCGVVEGFYGRPWTTEQRKSLFQRMKKMGLNTYLYAPKDDCKHRMYWRELYSVEEADHLTGLITSASESNVSFVYAISPGLDITFSSAKDVALLKKKLEQVASFGCKSFALLFDDIEVEMCESDKEIFQSFASAQVSVTNEVYQHLGQPSFLFCPTEYCASRAVPDVPSSEYLNTVGSKLLKPIDVLWTGPKVVSKKISVKSIEEVAKVLQRPPVIWDNIHANDYDRRRMFMGPYDGRSPELIPHLRGVLTNPNCEFEANYIAMHTLAQWCKSSVEGKRGTLPSDSPLRAEIKLETEVDYSSDDDLPSLHSSYKPREALRTAITDWYDEMLLENKPAHKTLPTSPALPIPTPVVSTCTITTSTTPTNPVPTTNCLSVKNINELNNLEVNELSYLQPAMSSVPLNSLVDSASESDAESVGEKVEPMDCVFTPGTSPASSEGMPSTTELKQVLDNNPLRASDSTVDIMQVDSDQASTSTSLPTLPSTHIALDGQSTSSTCDKYSITQEDLSLLIDLFYLPFEHGSRAVQMLSDFHWLKANCHVVTEARSKLATPEQIGEAKLWHEQADKMREMLTSYDVMMEHMCSIPNRAVLHNLFPYLWDMFGVLNVTRSFLDWLALGQVTYNSLGYMLGYPYTCMHPE